MDTDSSEPEIPLPGMLVGNIGVPFKINGVTLCGVAAEHVQSGNEPRKAKVHTRLALTSDDKIFHRIADNLCGVLTTYLNDAGHYASLRSADIVLLVAREDNSAELWVDTAAVTMEIVAKKRLDAGTAVFESDIADIVGMRFPFVSINPSDRVLCLMRVDWRFALFFDFNPDKNLDIQFVSRILGTLHRNLKYKHLYDVMADDAAVAKLMVAGWFPFAEILPTEFKELSNAVEANFSLENAEHIITSNFTDVRLNGMLQRWMTKPHLAGRETLLREAIQAFTNEMPGAVIKIIATEIEGVLTEAYRTANNFSGKVSTKDLMEFAVQSATTKFGSGDTLFLSDKFARYLGSVTFANFDPSGPLGNAGSRHAVGHGAADPASYTKARALQVLLTLDQLAFYT